MAWESDNHPWLMLAGKIGENYSVGGFSLVRTAHPTADGAVLLGVAAFLRAHFATALGAWWRFGWYLRSTVVQRFKT